MFFPAKMSNLAAIVYDTDVEQVTAEILRLGMLQITDVTESQDWAKEMPSVANEQMVETYERLSERIKGIASKLGKPISIKPEIAAKDLDPNSISRELDAIDEEANTFIERKRYARQEIGRLMSILTEAKSALKGSLPVGVSGPFSFLEARAVRISSKNVPILHSLLKGIPSVVLEIGRSGEKCDCLVMVLRKDRRTLDEALKEISFTKIEMPEKSSEETDETFAADIREKILKEEKELEETDKKLQEIASRKMGTLSDFLNLVHTRKVIHQAQSHFKKTQRTYVLSGWVPSREISGLVSRIRSITKGRCFVEETSAEELGATVDVPVKFQNPSFLKPFEMVTGKYGLPKYNTIDPTLFLAISFVAMFGAMFGDVGHGAVFALASLYFAVNKKFPESTRKKGALFLYAGISAVIFGFIYGSFFGPRHLSHILPYEGFEPLYNIQTLFKIAVYFGIGFMTVGIILNIINSMRSGDIFGGVFSKEGLLGAAMYWIGIILIVRLFTHGSVGMGLYALLVLIFGPILLFFLRAPIRKLFRPSEPMFHEGFALYIMESLIELVEIFSGYLANTMSFVRVAAFALAHGALFIAVYAIANAMGSIPGMVVHVVGNAGIIALEGLIVSIQAVRLEYYEFFGKFFRSGTREYKPSNMINVD